MIKKTLPFAIQIDTYEVNGEQETLTLSHIFYGKTLKEAVGIAHSHLITDFFYSSSFVGTMPWRNAELSLLYSGEVYGPKSISEDKIDEILDELEIAAVKINRQQIELGISKLILDIEK